MAFHTGSRRAKRTNRKVTAMKPSRLLPTTRANDSEDAHRDMDGFDPDEELRRMRVAIGISLVKAVTTAQRRQAMRFVVVMAANLDEHLSRGGTCPKEWLGPACMRNTKKDSGPIVFATPELNRIADRLRKLVAMPYPSASALDVKKRSPTRRIVKRAAKPKSKS